MKPNQSKYFIALVPPEPILSEVYQFKTYMKETYNCKAPLRSPPHITLHMPFAWRTDKESKLNKALVHASKEMKPFEFTLNGFQAFPPRVIYIAVEHNNVLLQIQSDLTTVAKTELNLFNANRYDLPYHPHLTVAFRDLKQALFTEAWNDFKERPFERSWTVNSFHLLKHDGKEWQILKEFSFDQ